MVCDIRSILVETGPHWFMSGRFAKNNAGKIVGSLKNFYLPDVSLLALAASSNAASGKDYSKDLIAFF